MATKRFSQGGFTFDTDTGWESLFMTSPGVRREVARTTAKLAGDIIKAAPRGPHVTTDEYSIKKNVHANVEEVDGEWVGFITIEENPRARHAMLQERGYRDPSGRRHRGLFYLKKVLERNRDL